MIRQKNNEPRIGCFSNDRSWHLVNKSLTRWWVSLLPLSIISVKHRENVICGFRARPMTLRQTRKSVQLRLLYVTTKMPTFRPILKRSSPGLRRMSGNKNPRKKKMQRSVKALLRSRILKSAIVSWLRKCISFFVFRMFQRLQAAPSSALASREIVKFVLISQESLQRFRIRSVACTSRCLQICSLRGMVLVLYCIMGIILRPAGLLSHIFMAARLVGLTNVHIRRWIAMVVSKDQIPRWCFVMYGSERHLLLWSITRNYMTFPSLPT